MAGLKIGIRFKDQAGIGAALASTAKRLGVGVEPDYSNAVPCVFYDACAYALAKQEHSNFMDFAAFFSLTDRLGMQSLGVPTVPTATDPDTLSGPIFIKHRRTYKAGSHSLCYTGWSSAQELMRIKGAEFLECQRNPNPLLGELVAQPLLTYPTEDLDVCFSVNPDGDVLFFAVCKMRYVSPGKAASIVSCDLPDDIRQRVLYLCKNLRVRGGFHNADFVRFNNEWCLADWNARLTFGVAQKHAGDAGFLDDALLHMCGGEVTQKPLMHFEQRGYFHKPIALNQYGRIIAAGAFPRVNNAGIDRISLTARTSDVAKNIYDTLGY